LHLWPHLGVLEVGISFGNMCKKVV
jgi:hypothetical protein